MGKRFIGLWLIALTVAFVLTGVVSSPTTAIAQSNDSKSSQVSSITLSPAVNRPNFNSGTISEKEIKIINTGEQSYEFVVYAGPYSVKTETYDPDFVTVNKSNQAYQWISFDKTKYAIKPGQTIDIPYKIIIPKDAAPGGHYAVIFAETQPPSSGQTSVERKKRVGSLMYMTINGAVKMAGKVEDWTSSLWQTKLPLAADVRVRNDGNTHFLTNTHITYQDIFSRDKLKYNQEAIVMPGTTRRISANWSHPPLPGVYKVSGHIELLGKTETLPYKYILYTPLWLLYSVAGIVIVVVGAGLLKKRNKKKRDKKKRSENDGPKDKSSD